MLRTITRASAGSCGFAVLCASSVLAIDPTAVGQDRLLAYIGHGAYNSAGSSVAGVGDVNGDGFADLLVGARGLGSDNVSGFYSGDARLISGKDGTELFAFFGDDDFDGFGNSVSGIGDVNGDGVRDLLVGAPYDYTANFYATGSIRVFSGSDGSLIRRLEGIEGSSEGLGYSMSSCGDVDGDGVDDLVAGIPDESTVNGAYSGAARVFSGASGAVLFELLGHSDDEYLGFSVAAAGDVDLDGRADVIIGSPYDDVGGSNRGAAYVCSGRTGVTLFTLLGTGPYFGQTVAGIGDVDHDGHPDVAVGASSAARYGMVTVFSGRSGAQLMSFTGDNGDNGNYFGTSIAGAGDVNGDGYADLLIGAINGHGEARAREGRALLISGKSGVVLTEIVTPVTDGDGIVQFGYCVAGVGDVNGDGLDDIAVGTPYDDTYGLESGGVYVFSGNDLFQSAWPLNPQTGETVTLTTREGIPGTPTVLVVVDINGTPTFDVVGGITVFDLGGGHSFSATVPPALSGMTMTVRSYAKRLHRRLMRSNDEVITFR